MKRMYFAIRYLTLISTILISSSSKAQLAERAFANAQQQVKKMLLVATPSMPPRTTNSDGSILFCPNIYDWTSGFFAGNLWLTYEATKDETLKAEAIRFTEALDSVQYFTGNHDIGFMLYCSYGNGYRLSNSEKYRKVLIQAAKSLCTRFNPKMGVIKSWDSHISWPCWGLLAAVATSRCERI